MSISTELSALPSWLYDVVAERGYERLTPVQGAILRPELSGRDLRIRSATGSGKTLAVAAALGEALEDKAGAAPAIGPRVLVLAPTRELATQLYRELCALYMHLPGGRALVIGGASYREELAALRAAPEVLVATPGRLVDHLDRNRVYLGDVIAVALDEADQLLELGFKDALDRILSACPGSRRTLLSSATFSRPVLALARRHQRDPVSVEGTPADQPHADIEHAAHVIHRRDQLAALTNVLLSAGDERTLVFVAMRARVADLAGELTARGFAVVGLSGEMSHAERSKALVAFRNGRARVLVATDVAARGIDVEDVRLVIHADPPRDVEALVHRSGRTGRAGQQGRSVQLLCPADVGRVRQLFQRVGLSLRVSPAPSAEQVERLLVERLVDGLTRGFTAQGALEDRRNAEVADALLAHLDGRELVVRLVGHLRRTRTCQPEPVEEVRPETERSAHHRAAYGSNAGFALFEVNSGRRSGATPQRIMAMVCRRGRIKKRDIGQIDVREGTTRVEVRFQVANAFARAAAAPDNRDRHIRIRPLRPPRRDEKGRQARL